VFQGTWLHGMFVAAQALLFTGDPDINYAGLNATIGAASASIFSSTQGFGSGGPATVPLALATVGTTLSMIQAAFHRASAAHVLSFFSSPALGITGRLRRSVRCSPLTAVRRCCWRTCPRSPSR
jgi:hypothetical protein